MLDFRLSWQAQLIRSYLNIIRGLWPFKGCYIPVFNCINSDQKGSLVKFCIGIWSLYVRNGIWKAHKYIAWMSTGSFFWDQRLNVTSEPHRFWSDISINHKISTGLVWLHRIRFPLTILSFLANTMILFGKYFLAITAYIVRLWLKI